MNKIVAIYKTEHRSDVFFHFGWLLGTLAYLILTVAIYPGDSAISSFSKLFDEPVFAAFLGNIDLNNPGYGLWLYLMIPFVVIAYMIYYVTAGVRVTMKSIHDKTGELVHTLPVTRTNMLGIRFSVAFTYLLLQNIILAIVIMIPFAGEAIPFEYAISVFWWGILFGLMCLSIGMLVGVLTGGMGRGQQFGLLVPLVFYGMQLFVNLQPDLSDLNKINPLTWYMPQEAMIGQDVPGELVAKIVEVFAIAFVLSFYLFQQKDLIMDTPTYIPYVSNLFSFRSKHRIPDDEFDSAYTVSPNTVPVRPVGRTRGSSKNNLFVFWGRLFEKRFPFTADFLYSEGRVMLISFIVVVMIWPLQLMAYPGDEIIQPTISSFGSQGIMKLFTYGHNLTNQPYLWFLATQTHGNHYFLFLPLSAHWAGKAIRKDAETMNGEIIGSVAIPPYKVVLQRFLAIILEIVYLVVWMIIFLLLSEAVTGASYSLPWEIISILCLIPLYVFLITLSFSLTLLFERRGLVFARVMMVVMLLLFIVGVMTESFTPVEQRWVKGIFGLYDPILMIKDQSLTTNNNGELILLGLSILTTAILFMTAKYYNWINVKRDTAFDLIAPN